MECLVVLGGADVRGAELERADRGGPESELEYSLEEGAASALEAAVQIRDATEAGSVTAAVLGSQTADSRLRTALARGADRALRLWDDEGGEWLPLEMGRGTVVQALIEQRAADIVLTGSSLSATAVAAADGADYGWATDVTDFEVTGERTRIHVERTPDVETSVGVSVSLPAVVSVRPELNEPRYTKLSAIAAAQAAEIDVLDSEDLGLGAPPVETGCRIISTRERSSSDSTEWLEGSTQEQAEQLASILGAYGGAV